MLFFFIVIGFPAFSSLCRFCWAKMKKVLRGWWRLSRYCCVVERQFHSSSSHQFEGWHSCRLVRSSKYRRCVDILVSWSEATYIFSMLMTIWLVCSIWLDLVRWWLMWNCDLALVGFPAWAQGAFVGDCPGMISCYNKSLPIHWMDLAWGTPSGVGEALGHHVWGWTQFVWWWSWPYSQMMPFVCDMLLSLCCTVVGKSFCGGRLWFPNNDRVGWRFWRKNTLKWISSSMFGSFQELK